MGAGFGQQEVRALTGGGIPRNSVIRASSRQMSFRATASVACGPPRVRLGVRRSDSLGPACSVELSGPRHAAYRAGGVHTKGDQAGWDVE